jgi:hypothetical protein
MWRQIRSEKRLLRVVRLFAWADVNNGVGKAR